MKGFRFDDPDTFAGGTPYQEFARLRREAPFAWHSLGNDPSDGFWLATKHRDIMAISKNPTLFDTKAVLLSEPLPIELWPSFPALAMTADHIGTYESERHAQFRSAISPMFHGPRIREMEDEVRALCARAIADVRNLPHFDFANDVALRIPVEVVLGMFLGIPRSDQRQFAQWVLTLNAMDDPFFRPRASSLLETAQELYEYGMALLHRLRMAPDHGVLSDIVHHITIEGVELEQLFFGYWFPLAVGAFDTTAASITGGVQALMQFPEQLRRMRRDPGLIPLAAEEIIRWVSPVIYFRRTAAKDIDFDGHAIKRGDKIALCYASANRDEDVFTSPDTFDVGRRPNPHMSFGYGPHRCLGARLAAMIIGCFLEVYLDRIPLIESHGKIVRTRSAWLNKIRSMPVRNVGKEISELP
jgi:cytochrome P450